MFYHVRHMIHINLNSRKRGEMINVALIICLGLACVQQYVYCMFFLWSCLHEPGSRQ